MKSSTQTVKGKLQCYLLDHTLKTSLYRYSTCHAAARSATRAAGGYVTGVLLAWPEPSSTLRSETLCARRIPPASLGLIIHFAAHITLFSKSVVIRVLKSISVRLTWKAYAKLVISYRSLCSSEAFLGVPSTNDRNWYRCIPS